MYFVLPLIVVFNGLFSGLCSHYAKSPQHQVETHGCPSYTTSRLLFLMGNLSADPPPWFGLTNEMTSRFPVRNVSLQIQREPNSGLPFSSRNTLLLLWSVWADGSIIHPDAHIQKQGHTGDFFSHLIFHILLTGNIEGSASETRLHSAFLHFHRCRTDFIGNHFLPALLYWII